MKTQRSPQKKILIICPFTAPGQGGVESHIQKLVKYIGQKNRNAIISSYQPLLSPIKAKIYEKKNNYEIYRLPWYGNGLFNRIEHNALLTFFYLVPGLFLSTLWIGILRRKEISVIHAHGFAAGLIGIILGKIIRKRAVISTHAIYSFEKRPLLAFFIKIILQNYDYILAVGEPSKKELIAIGLPKEKIGVHPNWVDTTFFKPSKNRNIKEPLTAIFCGRGLEKKGIFLFGEVARKNPMISFKAIVAEGPDREKFINIYGKLKNLTIITKLPVKFEEKMKTILAIYQSADVFLMPSLYPEGFASVVLEASSTGLAMISSNLGTLPSMIKGSPAYLIDPNERNFSTLLRKLDRQRTLLLELKNGMRNFSLGKFSEKNAEVIYNSYCLNQVSST